MNPALPRGNNQPGASSRMLNFYTGAQNLVIFPVSGGAVNTRNSNGERGFIQDPAYGLPRKALSEGR
jgi:hypothetical protein